MRDAPLRFVVVARGFEPRPNTWPRTGRAARPGGRALACSPSLSPANRGEGGLVLVRHGVGEPPFGAVACGDSLPVGAHAGDLADLRRAAPMAQVSERAGALDVGRLPVVAGEDHLGRDPARFRQLLACHTPVQHGRLSRHRTCPNLSVGSSVGARASQISRLGQLVAKHPDSFHPSH
jgi:hypothetical protein